MGKDREGKFHPGKGRPSGRGKAKGIIQPAVDEEKRQQQDRLEDKYAIDPDTGDANGTYVRHPNRKLSKDNDRNKQTNKAAVEKTTVVPQELVIELSKDLLEELEAHQGLSVSIYFGTHRQGADVNDQVDPILFKNALQEAESELKIKTNNSKVERILKPAYELLDNKAFWQNLPEGLAFFITEDFFKYIRLPFAPEQRTVVNNSFLVTPLVPFLPDNKYFYLLLLSKSHATLYVADKVGMQKVNVAEMSEGIDDVVHLEEKEGRMLFRTGSSGDGRGANYHGTGEGKPDEKENIAMYLTEIDRTLWKEVLHQEHAPLLLAAVDHIAAIYKKVTQYKYVLDQALTGNFEHEDESVLYEKAMRTMNAYFTQRTQLALTEFGNRSATELTSVTPDEIIPGAYYARVAHLFVRAHDQLWGNFDEVNNELTLHEQWRDNDDDLMDKAVLQTLLNGGEVHVLEHDSMPVDSKLAAVFRY
jgi:hypothetical protein